MLRVKPYSLSKSAKTNQFVRFKSSIISEIPFSKEENIKPFSEIPGPKPLPFIGNAHQFFLSGGLRKFYLAIHKWHEEFGPIIKFRIGKQTTVSVSNVDLIEQVFRETSRNPVRVPIPVTNYYAKEKGLPPNLADAEGEEWSSQRKPLSRPFLHPTKTDKYIDSLNPVANDYVKLLEKFASSNPSRIIPDLSIFSQRYAFEAVSAVLFGEGLGALKEPVDIEAREFMNEAILAIRAMGENIIGFPWHEFIPIQSIPVYKRFARHFDKVFEIGNKIIETKGNKFPNSLLNQILNSETPKPVIDYIVPSVLAAGVDTTQTAFNWIIYALSFHTKKQEKLYEEINRVIPEDTLISPEKLHQMKYLKNFVQEVLRYHTPIGANVRTLKADLNLGGYKIPSETSVYLFNLSTTRDKNVWGDPENFRPERFDEKINSFASLTFGQGARVCLGQRIALSELQVGLAYLCRTFRVEYKGDRQLKPVQRIFLEPDGPIRVALHPRKK